MRSLLGFRSLGLRIYRVFKVQGLGFRGLGFRGSGFRVFRFRVRLLGFNYGLLGLRVSGFGFEG